LKLAFKLATPARAPSSIFKI